MPIIIARTRAHFGSAADNTERAAIVGRLMDEARWVRTSHPPVRPPTRPPCSARATSHERFHPPIKIARMNTDPRACTQVRGVMSSEVANKAKLSQLDTEQSSDSFDEEFAPSDDDDRRGAKS